MDRGQTAVQPAPATVRPGSAHILPLDGFRGVAVVLVVFFHVAQVSMQGHGVVISWMEHLQQTGWVGVQMFFTLSGFLITGILLRTVEDPHYFSSFYIRRVLRIFPLYYGVLLALCVVALFLGLSWHGSLPYLVLYLQNFRTEVLQLNLELSNAHLSITLRHFWTLAVEEQFYLVWPFLVWAMGGKRMFVWVPVVFIVLCPVLRLIGLHRGLAFAPLRYWTPFDIDSLAWGGLGAAVQRFGTLRSARRFEIGALVVGGVLTLAVLWSEHGVVLEGARQTTQVFYSSFGAFCCGMLLLISRPGTLTGRMFANAGLRWFGRYSYGIYVFHLLLMQTYESLRYFVIGVTGSRALGAIAMIGSAYAISAGIAFVSYHVYERRFLDMKDKIAAYSVQRRARQA